MKKAKDMSHIWLFIGDNNKIQSAINSGKRKIIGTDDFQEVFVDVKDIDFAIDEIKSMPLFTSTKVILLTAASKVIAAQVVDAIYDMPSSNYLFIITEGIDKRSKLFKDLNKAGNIVIKDRIESSDIKDITHWCQRYVVDNKCSIHDDAIVLLLDRIGGHEGKDGSKVKFFVDLYALGNELDKLFLYIGDNDVITKNDVDIVVASSGDRSIYDINTAVFKSDVKKALHVLHQVLDSQKNISQTLSFVNSLLYNLSNTYKALLFMKSLQEKGIYSKDIVTISNSVLHSRITSPTKGDDGDFKAYRYSLPQLYAISNGLSNISMNDIYKGIVCINDVYSKVRDTQGVKNTALMMELLVVSLCKKEII